MQHGKPDLALDRLQPHEAQGDLASVIPPALAGTRQEPRLDQTNHGRDVVSCKQSCEKSRAIPAPPDDAGSASNKSRTNIQSSNFDRDRMVT